MDEYGKQKWIGLLGDEDVSFLKKFILHSGSLKEMAKEYGVTYPTIRLRLDRVIEKIKILDNSQEMSDFERILRAKYAEGKVDVESFNILLNLYRSDVEEKS